MISPSSDKALTVDANVVHYYFVFTRKHPLPEGLNVMRMADFCVKIIDKYPIAYSGYIKTEYEKIEGLETIKNWLAKRLQKNLAIEVTRKSLPNEIKSCLNTDYGFDCGSGDAKYLETCLNTIRKHFITENTKHFFRRHRSRGRVSMPEFLSRKIAIKIDSIDECCCSILGS